jgi:tetratricopeptide (TPR) repeat protein
MSPGKPPVSSKIDILPIHPDRGPARPPTGARAGRRLKKAALLLLACAALTAVGLGWIAHLARGPAAPEADPGRSQAAGEPAAQSPPAAEPGIEPAEAAAEPAAPALDPQPAAEEKSTDPSAAVGRLLASAARKESDGSLSAALADYDEALGIDSASAPARAGRQRVKDRMADEHFRGLMAAGIRAIDAGDFETARAALLKAKTLRPNAREADEALSQAEAGARAARIESLRQKALSAEQREDWKDALAACESALALEPDLQFARNGRANAAAFIALEASIGRVVSRPEILGSDAELASAERLLAHAQSLPSPGPRLTAGVLRLEALVEAARTPVAVTIESDELTDIAVYRVGKLGRFRVRTLSLRPGTYTVVGSRDGYQDVRREIVVRPGPEPLRVAVACRTPV